MPTKFSTNTTPNVPPSNRPVAYTSLKQRTSSVDCRKDYSQQTLFSLLRLLKLREYFITVDHFKIWRRHLAWAKQNGSDLRNHLTQRFASNMVFMSLLLGAELNVLFNSSHITTKMRQDMSNQNLGSFEFWIGIVIIVSAVLTLLTLITTFTAWGMVSSISDNNAHCVLRSSIGQYVVHLPSNLIVAAIYSFLLSVVLWLFVLLPGVWPYVLLLFLGSLFFHIVIVFSAFGRLIMHSGAMGTERIFDEEFEQDLLPHGLHTSLLCEAMTNLENNKSITRQYRRGSKDNSFSSLDFNSSQNSLNNSLGGSDRQRLSLSESLSKSPFPDYNARKNGNSGNLGKSELSESMTSLDSWLAKNVENDTPAPPPPKTEDSELNTETTPERKATRRTSNGTVLPRPSVLNSANHSRKSFKRINNIALMGDSPDVENPQKERTPEEVRRRRKVSWDNFNMEKIMDETSPSVSETDTPITSHKRPSPRNELGVIREPENEWASNGVDPELGEVAVGDDLKGGKGKFNVFSLNDELEAEEKKSSFSSDNENDDPNNETQHLLSGREGTKQYSYWTKSEPEKQQHRHDLYADGEDALLFGK